MSALDQLPLLASLILREKRGASQRVLAHPAKMTPTRMPYHVKLPHHVLSSSSVTLLHIMFSYVTLLQTLFNLTGEFCQPLGDRNVWGTLYPITEPLENNEVVVLAAKVNYVYDIIIEKVPFLHPHRLLICSLY